MVFPQQTTYYAENVFWTVLTVLLAFVAGWVAGAALTHWLRLRRGTDTSETFKDRAAGIQSYVLSGAVLVGGIWSFYTFVVMDVLKLFEQAVVNIEVDARQESVDRGQLVIAANVRVTNTGKRNVFLDYRHPLPFSVAKASFDDEGHSSFGNWVQQRGLSDWRVLRVGETVRYSFAVAVPDAGIYIVQFAVPIPPAEIGSHDKISEAAGAPKRPHDKQIFWVGSTILNVHGTLRK